MIDEVSKYQKIKNWCKDHTKELQIGACLVLMFFVGFGVGKYNQETMSDKRRDKFQLNYTKNQTNPQNPVQDKVEAVGTQTGAGEADCKIKGNISSTGKMTYHLSTGAFYKNTKAEKCFNTEQEAKQAGFTKSSR